MWESGIQYGGGFAWIVPLALWSGVWTGLSLWHAARRGEHWWFVFFLLIHTAGIAEILYLIFVAQAFSSHLKSPPRTKKKR